MVDYVVIPKEVMKNVKDVKIIPVEEWILQKRLLTIVLS